MTIDPWILAFSAVTVIATIWMGIWSARRSKTTSDFFVAGRSVSVGWNASAISGEYLSAASFMGVAGMVMSSGYDALWYPVCYACGYLFLLLFIAGPLRRFGAYTIPDFAEGRFDSPVFRKIAVVFVLFIGFFYTMPQMKGAGTTLAYIFPGLPYWAGVVLVGAVITLNVALGGMKGITLVQAFQYWAKMFAISVPIFVLMAVYGHYGKQLEMNESGAMATSRKPDSIPASLPLNVVYAEYQPSVGRYLTNSFSTNVNRQDVRFVALPMGPYKDWVKPNLSERIWKVIYPTRYTMSGGPMPLTRFLKDLQGFGERKHVWVEANLFAVFGHAESEFSPKNYEYSSESNSDRVIRFSGGGGSRRDVLARFEADLKAVGISALALDKKILVVVPTTGADAYAELARIQLADSLKPVSDFARKPLPEKAPADSTWLSPFGPLTTKAAKAAKLSAEESKPYSLLYTYSLIIALVCGTAGLPHILVRFYTNPDGVAAKRTTMWVMILIGVFYLFPPVFGVMGRNLLPDLYAGVGAKGTDKIVLELPRILNEKGSATVPVALSGVAPDSPRAEEISARTPKPAGETPSLPSKRKIPWGSILSGITCAGAFAAFMSTFSGLLVSMTGAMAHDVYGRMLRPKATPEQRLRAFKIAAVGIGAVAILLGMQVEPLQINFMVGQAFAIAAASYFPLLFMSCWWRGMTMKGAALGMLAGGVCALAAVTLTNFSDLGWFKLADFWAAHPLLRILCEQPAIWTVPLAIGLMVVVSKLTVKEVPADIRMKMLVLHAPEKLGLKQEYIQEHAQGH